MTAGFWVFAYGSLMWRPGFAFVEAAPARLAGAHRALCIYSHVHRGTPERPGLVLGLDRGGTCLGTAFRITEESGDSVLAYLRERELVTSVYREVRRPVRLAGRAETVTAVAFLADRRHAQYAGRLPADEQLAIVRAAAGVSGANRDYVLSTVDHLRGVGIRDPALERLADRLRAAG